MMVLLVIKRISEEIVCLIVISTPRDKKLALLWLIPLEETKKKSFFPEGWEAWNYFFTFCQSHTF